MLIKVNILDFERSNECIECTMMCYLFKSIYSKSSQKNYLIFNFEGDI